MGACIMALYQDVVNTQIGCSCFNPLKPEGSAATVAKWLELGANAALLVTL